MSDRGLWWLNRRLKALTAQVLAFFRKVERYETSADNRHRLFAKALNFPVFLLRPYIRKITSDDTTPHRWLALSFFVWWFFVWLPLTFFVGLNAGLLSVFVMAFSLYRAYS